MTRKIFFLSVIIVVSLSCTEKIFTEGENLFVIFSTDTIHFDTVFTTFGSTTRELRVTNPYKSRLKIDNISLQGGESSSFRINIDGEATTSLSEIEIAPNDSLFIFVDVIIDPLGVNNPVSVLDSILIQIGNSRQYINLVAWGQDIHLLSGEVIGTSTWTKDKPWVIYNSVMVDTGEILTIDAGARVLFHRGSTMYVAGTLLVNGETSERVIFGSDRIEQQYSDIPGQWNGIYFINVSSDNRIENAIIENGVSGLHLGNLGSIDTPPDLIIRNSVIRNMTVVGLSSLGGTVEAVNCEISHCGFYSLFLAMGGEYSFTHCTVANLWEYSVRITPAVLISDYYDYDDIRYQGVLNTTSFRNSVIYGSLSSEMEILPADNGNVLDLAFEYSLLKVNLDNPVWSNYDLTTSMVNSDPGFIAFNQFDFRPDTLSVLTGSADPLISLTYPNDLRGYDRFVDNGPDIGAYERQPGEKSKQH